VVFKDKVGQTPGTYRAEARRPQTLHDGGA
jgi:hypothetical protein